MAVFKKKEKTNLQPDSTSAVAPQTSNLGPVDENGLVKTTLVFHPDWELSNQEKYVYMYQHQKLPLLKENQVSIQGLKLLPFDDGFVVVAFLRNTLPKTLQFENISIVLLDHDGKTLAKKTFELDTMGELPPMSCMPWRFLFENEDKLVETIPDEGWSLAFEINRAEKSRHLLDLEESWEHKLTPVEKDRFERMVSSLPALGQNEINLMGLEAKPSPDGGLAVSILFRNGSAHELQFEKLQLAVKDATNNVICQGSFSLADLKVRPNTSKPWTLVFPKELMLSDAPDLSSWQVYPIQ